MKVRDHQDVLKERGGLRRAFPAGEEKGMALRRPFMHLRTAAVSESVVWEDMTGCEVGWYDVNAIRDVALVCGSRHFSP